MPKVIQARLDSETDHIRKQLQKQLGWSDSQVVREGITRLSSLVNTKGKRKIIGQGKFNSGIHDLATNKKYMEDYGS